MLLQREAARLTQLGLFTQKDRESAVLGTQWAIIPVWKTQTGGAASFHGIFTPPQMLNTNTNISESFSAQLLLYQQIREYGRHPGT